MPTWPELQSQLSLLRDDVPRMLRDHPARADFLGEFAGVANGILGRTPPELAESVHTELGAILRDLELADDGED